MRHILYKWFLGRVAELKDDCMISEEQYERIYERYYPKSQMNAFTISSVISLFGAILVGSGIILFLSSSWDKMGDWTRFAIICSFLFSSYFSGYYLYNFSEKKKTGKALVFLGNILFGGAIFLVAQIFNIQSRYHNGQLAWGLLIIPFMFIFRDSIFFLFPLIILGFWNLAVISDFHTLNLLYPLIILVLTVLALRKEDLIGFNACIFSIMSWFLFSLTKYYTDYPQSISAVFMFLGIGLIFYFFTNERIMCGRIFRSFWSFWSGIVLFFSIFSLSHKGEIRRLGEILIKGDFPDEIFYISLLLFLLSLFFYFRNFKNSESVYFPLIPYSLYVIPLFFYIPESFIYTNSLVMIFTNLVLLFYTVEFIRKSIKEGNIILVNMGILFFAIHFFTRYFDYAHRYLPKGLYFLITGSVLILVSYFIEKKRRIIVNSIREEK